MELSHRWITDKAESRDSGIHGIGVYATEDIEEGEKVGVLGGMAVSKQRIEQYWEEVGHVGIQISDRFFVVPEDKAELEDTGVFNHSCEPNVGFSSQLVLEAMTDIEEGEELVFDYAFCESLHPGFKCNCGSENCRGEVTSEDWKKEELQQKYGEYFAPYLRKKID